MAEQYLKMVIYGEDAATSRTFLLSLRKRFDNVEVVLTTDADMSMLEEKILAEDMFATGKKLVILEGLPKSQPHLDFLNTAPQNVILWIDGKPAALTGKAGQALSNFTKKEFPELIPTTAFTLVNPFFARELNKSLLAIEALTEKKVPMELIIGAIGFRLRQLTLLHIDGTVPKVAPNQLSRIKTEGARWPLSVLIRLYEALIDLDFNNKNGTINSKQGLINLVYGFLLQ